MSGYTKEELLFAAMHHDLGKVGFPGEGNEVYQVETSDWHRKNQNKMYRCLMLMQFLQDKPRHIHTMARYLGVNIRTVYRYLKLFEAVGY